MGTTQPIRNKNQLKQFVNYYLYTNPVPRNYALIVMGLNTALRISDILKLKWSEVYDFNKKKFKRHLMVHEAKTGKENIIALNKNVQRSLSSYMIERHPNPDNYIFTKTTDYTLPLSRSQAFRIVKKAAMCAVAENNISCHSLRKTFGYHAWKQGTPPALLMDIYNHSSYSVTKRYLGIDQDERDAIFMKIEL